MMTSNSSKIFHAHPHATHPAIWVAFRYCLVWLLRVHTDAVVVIVAQKSPCTKGKEWFVFVAAEFSSMLWRQTILDTSNGADLRRCCLLSLAIFYSSAYDYIHTRVQTLIWYETASLSIILILFFSFQRIRTSVICVRCVDFVRTNVEILRINWTQLTLRPPRPLKEETKKMRLCRFKWK